MPLTLQEIKSHLWNWAEILRGSADEIVRYVRFDGWQNTHAGEREVKMAPRKTRFNEDKRSQI